MFLASRTFIAMLICGVLAAVPASAPASTIGVPGTGFKTCAWGYTSPDLIHPAAWGFGQTITGPPTSNTPTTDNVLDSFSFWVTQWQEPKTIAFKTYVSEWDAEAQAPGAPIWESDIKHVTTDASMQEVRSETGGIDLVQGKMYALWLSTHETNHLNVETDLACYAGGHEFFYPDGFELFWSPHGSEMPWDLSWARTQNFDIRFSASLSSRQVYDFDGFYAPVNNGVLNEVRAGAAIPIRFSLGGDRGLDVFDAGYPKSEGTSCGTGAVDGIEQTVEAGASSLSYAAGSDTYTYVWKTDKAWSDSCRQLVLRFDDGTTARVNFSFTR